MIGDRIRRAREEVSVPIGALAYETHIDVIVLLAFERATKRSISASART